MYNNIFVLFDRDCALCVQCRDWLTAQSQHVHLTFIPANSAEAHRIFPRINHDATKTDLTVIADDGGVYTAEKAWLMCLWSLKEYRSWAFRLASPELMPGAKSIISTISKNRKAISKLIA